MSDSIPPEAWEAAGKTGERIVDRLFDLFGASRRPKLVIDMAKAKAEASRIAANAEIDIAEMHQRAKQRYHSQEIAYQQNMQAIIREAMPLLVDQREEKTNLDNEWFSAFYEKAKVCSDDQMQQLWAKVIAGEINSTGTFCKKTMSIIADMEKDDAALFSNLCKFRFTIGEPVIVIRTVPYSLYDKFGINFNSLKRLEHIGLIEVDNVNGYKKLNLSQEGGLFYFNTLISMKLPESDKTSLPYGSVYLTKSGKELSRIAGAEPDTEILKYSTSQWEKDGVTISSIQEMPVGDLDMSEVLSSLSKLAK